MTASLFQDPNSTYVYNYTQQPINYNSQKAGYLVNGATYDSCANTVGGCDLSLNASQAQYFLFDTPSTTFSFPAAMDGSGFTLAGWFYPVTPITSGMVLVDISGTISAARASVYFTSSNTLSTMYNSGTGITGYASSSVSITPNQWHYFCWTVRSTLTGNTTVARQTLYIDGTGGSISDSTATYAPFTVATATYGGRLATAGSYFNGRINEIRFYSRVLTTPEVATLASIYNYIGYLKSQGLYVTTNAICNIPSNPVFPFSATPTYNSKNATIMSDGLGTNGAAIQVDLSGTFSYLSVSRTPAFSATDPNLFNPATGQTMVDGNGNLLVSPANTAFMTASATGTPTFIDKTVAPGITYSYSFVPYIQGLYSATVTSTPTIQPQVNIQAYYDISYGALTGKVFGLHGSQVQVDLSGGFTYLTITRTPAFDVTSSVVSPGTVTYTPSRTLTLYNSTAGAAVPSNATVYLLQTGATGLALVDTTVYPNTQYTYNILPTLVGSAAVGFSSATATVPSNTVLGTTSITLPPITVASTYDASYGAVLSSSSGINGAVVQIDVSGQFTAMDVSRNPAFISGEITGLDPTTYTLRVYDASTNLAPTTNAYLTVGTTYLGVSGQLFIDGTVYPGVTYSYSFTPYIRDTAGSNFTAFNTVTNKNTITITAVSTGIAALPASSPYTPPSNGISAAPLTSNSIPGVTISAGTPDPTSAASAIGGFIGGGSGSGSGGSSGSGSGGSSGAGGSGAAADPAANLASGSSGLVTSVVSSGAPASSVGLSATGGAPSAPPATSPGTITLANGSVPGLFTGTLPSAVSTYFVAQTTSSGTVSMGQSIAVPTPPAGSTGCGGNLQFYAWPAAGYDPGTTLTVMIGGVPILSNYAFPSTGTGTDPCTPFNIPFSNLPAGNAQVTFLVTNANGTTNSSICMGGVAMNYSFTQGAGASATDSSGLVLYYPFDVSTNVGTRVKNYAQPMPVTDASLNGTATIVSSSTISSATTIAVGSGCLALDGTSGCYTQLGQWQMPTSGGFSITGWMYVTSATNRACICSLASTGSYFNLVLSQVASSYKLSITFSSEGSTSTLVSTNSINPYCWYYISVVYTVSATNSLKLYINNVLDNQVLSINTSYYHVVKMTTNYLGGTPTNVVNGTTVSNYNGYIDDFRLYNRALTTSDMTALWMYGINSVGNMNFVDPTGLSLYYPIEQASGITNPP